jgi:hypothetical protein
MRVRVFEMDYFRHLGGLSAHSNFTNVQAYLDIAG